MAERQLMTFGTIRLTPKTADQINAITNPVDGQIAFCTDDSSSTRCIVFYDADNGAWYVSETGSAMG